VFSPSLYSILMFCLPNYRSVSTNNLDVKNIFLRKVDLFENDFLLVPVHDRQSIHWSLIWVELQRKKMYYYCSCGGKMGKRFMTALIPWLEMEASKKGTTISKKWDLCYDKQVRKMINFCHFILQASFIFRSLA